MNGTELRNKLAVKLSKPIKQEDGSLVVEAIFAKEGIYDYDNEHFSGSAYLPKSELKSKSFLETVNGCPLVDDHITVSPENYRNVTKGNCYDVMVKGDSVVGKVKIYDPDIIDRVVEAKEPLDVSLEYKLDIDLVSNKEYQGIQKNLRVNHLALVQTGNMPDAKIQNKIKEENNFMESKEVEAIVTKLLNAEAEKKKQEDTMAKNMGEFKKVVEDFKNYIGDMMKPKEDKEKKNESDDKEKSVKNSYENVLKARGLYKSLTNETPDESWVTIEAVASNYFQKSGKEVESSKVVDTFLAFEHFADLKPAKLENSEIANPYSLEGGTEYASQS